MLIVRLLNNWPCIVRSLNIFFQSVFTSDELLLKGYKNHVVVERLKSTRHHATGLVVIQDT